MWALCGGKRDRNHSCTTHPAVIESVRLRDHPEEAFVLVGQNDGHIYCHCERCAQVAEREGCPSAPALGVASEVTQRVAQEFPEARIMASAYHGSRKPPAHVRPRENVMIALASIECDFGHPLAMGVHEKNMKFRKDVEGWSRIADQRGPG